MDKSSEAAAMWGLAQNVLYPVADRLACALKALEFYGSYYEEVRQEIARINQETNAAAIKKELRAPWGHHCSENGSKWVVVAGGFDSCPFCGARRAE